MKNALGKREQRNRYLSTPPNKGRRRRERTDRNGEKKLDYTLPSSTEPIRTAKKKSRSGKKYSRVGVFGLRKGQKDVELGIVT